ncbi:MAG: glycosyltransferase family 2 protein [Phycisphaerales bacterium]
MPETRPHPADRPADHEGSPLVSVVVPMLDEEPNVESLWRELDEVAAAWPFRAEFVFVDDGSTDRTLERLADLTAADPRVTIVSLARRFGQTAALAAGFRHATGDVMVPMDADLQNDPRDIPMLVAALDDAPGFDVVSGWRKNRQDGFVLRRLPSILANKLITRLTWLRIHDLGCTLKAYRADLIRDIPLYGEMHRFLPAICQWQGGRVTERVVNHRPRTAGTSKYNLKRTFKVLLDLVTVKFLGDYLTKPLYFFGKLGALTMLLSFAVLFIAVLQKFSILYPGPEGLNLNRNILVQGAMMLFMMAFIMILMGVMAELLVRIYHESQDKTPYRVRRVIKPGTPDPQRPRLAPEDRDAPTRSA